MAEFQEVMRQWSRMCSGHCCDNRDGAEGMPICPIIVRHSGWPCDSSVTDLSLADVAMVEEIVMTWAAEHPEPKYPTWREWLIGLGVISFRSDFNKLVDPAPTTVTNVFVACLNDKASEPISAEIAQKLGLKPKEG